MVILARAFVAPTLFKPLMKAGPILLIQMSAQLVRLDIESLPTGATKPRAECMDWLQNAVEGALGA